MPTPKLPLTIISGYLGAGKTTLLNQLLTQATGRRCAVLVNDFGEVNIDAALITRHDGDTISLQNGCMCCSMADGFSTALARILKNPGQLDHIVVEASGVADPGKIAQTAQAFRVPIDGIIVVADAEQVRNQAVNRYVGETVCRQLAQADMIVVNKSDLVSENDLATLRDWVGVQAPAVPVHVTAHGLMPVDVLLGSVPHKPSLSLAHAGQHGAAYHSWLLTRGRPVSQRALARLADRLGRRVFRAKGFVRLSDDPQQLNLFQQVGSRWTLQKSELPNFERCGVQIVVIEPARSAGV